MIFTTKRQINKECKNLSLKLNNFYIEKVEHYKYLGCIISHSLNWTDHISYVRSKIAKVAPVLYRIQNKLNSKSRLLVYNSIAKPHLQYASEIYSKGSKTMLDSLQSMQNKLLKIIYGRKRFEVLL